MAVIIIVKDQYGLKHECKVLLDSDSQLNFITSAMIKKFGLPCTELDSIVKIAKYNTIACV